VGDDDFEVDLEAVGSFGLLAAIAKELNCLRCIVKAFSHTFVRTRHLFSSRGNCSVLAVFVFLTMKGIEFRDDTKPLSPGQFHQNAVQLHHVKQFITKLLV
jgi:hypothetical protein